MPELLQAANDSPSNQDLWVGDNIGVGRIENEFQNGTTDRAGFLTPLPADCDTSCHVKFKWSIASNSSGGNIRWVIRYAWTSEGDAIYDTTTNAPTVAANEQEIILVEAAPTSNDTEKWYSVELELSKMIARRGLNVFPDTL
jgi:hypothetical protein